MAEETKQGQQDAGPPPWEMEMNPVAKKAGEVIDTIGNAVSAGIKKIFPWEMDFGGKRDLQAPPAPVAPQKGSYSFEQVFSRLVGTESGGKHTTASGALTTSPVGAQGITQVMPKTGKVPGYGVTPIQNNSKEEYLRFGKDYLRAMLREFDGDYEKAVAAYNAGAGSVKKAITKGGENWKDFLPKRSETLPYLEKILGVVTGSKEAKAAADFSQFTSGNTTKTTTGHFMGKPVTVEAQSQGVRAAIVKTIQDKFPQFASDINTKITAQEADEGSVASYGGLAGDTIKAGRIKGETVKRTFQKEVEHLYDSPKDLSEPLTTMLHELQHARMSEIGKFDYGLGANWKEMLKDAEAANFPSVGTQIGGGDNLNEFLSTATVIKEMQKAGYPIEGRFAQAAGALPALEKKYPWLKQYIINYIQPEPLQAGARNSRKK